MTAQQTASNLASGERVAWGGLERAAFEDFPEVVSALRGSGAGRESNRKFIYFVPLALLVGVIYAAPVWGVVTVVGPWALSQTSRTAEGDITVGSIIFVVALVSLLIHSGLWLGSGRPARTALLGSSGMAFFLGAISTGVATLRGIDESVPAWQLWILPMVACVVAGGIFFFLVVRARRRAPAQAEPVRQEHDFRASPAYIAAVREAISRVGDEDGRLIRDDLVAAIDDLERRGVVTTADARQARSAELGFLAAQMSSPPLP